MGIQRLAVLLDESFEAMGRLKPEAAVALRQQPLLFAGFFRRREPLCVMDVVRRFNEPRGVIRDLADMQ